MQFSVYCLQSTVFDLHSILLSVQFTGLQLRFDHTVCLDTYFTKTLVRIKIDSAVLHISRDILEFSDNAQRDIMNTCNDPRSISCNIVSLNGIYITSTY